VITSTQNPRLKAAARLRESTRERERSGQILIDGLRAARLADERGITLIEIFLAADRASHEEAEFAHRLAARGVVVEEVAPEAFRKVAYGDAPDHLVAVAQRPETGLDHILPPKPALLVVVEGVEKPGNLGAILRTADAVGVHGVIVSGPGCDPFGPNVVRSSRGTLFSVPLAVAEPQRVADWLYALNIPLVAATPDAEHLYTAAPLAGPCAIAVGAEHAGLSPELRAAASFHLKLPMRGAADSLNVSVTCAVLLYEALRQRAAL